MRLSNPSLGFMNQSLAPESLADLFEIHRDREWYFVSPGGNWGDHLIYAGANALARRAGLHWRDLDYKSIRVANIPEGAAIYLHGSGGFNPWCSGRAFGTLRMATRVPGAIVVQGPQSCDIEMPQTRQLFADALAESPCAAIHMFARERTSANFLAGIPDYRLQLHLDQDTALHLSTKELLGMAGLSCVPQGRYELLASREDNEAHGVVYRGDVNAVVIDPARFARDFVHWLRLHAFASRITTNRLHSSIVGSLLGKPVQLLPGSYHKNLSVWEFSLRDRGVEWREVADQPKNADPSSSQWLPRRIVESWKVQHALLWLRGVPLR
jgi:hypothetical protein